MSGFLRRITRSRPADAGEPLQEGRAAETEGAAPAADTPPAGAATPGSPWAATPAGEDATASHVDAVGTAGGGATSGDAAAPSGGDATASMTNDPTATTSSVPAAAPSKRSRWRPFRRRTEDASVPPAPVLLADPNVPAGVDFAEQPLRPPAGRRGRLRRRLRYLRRARELMLRDLGGLLYEVHRTGGGSVEAHATVVGAKVQRIVRLDAEVHAIETALGASRSEAVVFEPGVGGTCANCGELYSSDARFCSNCGTAIGAPPKSPAIVSEPARTAFWRRAARPASSGEGATASAGAGGDQTAAANDAPAGSGPPATDVTSETPVSGEQPAASGDEPASDPATSSEQPAASGDEPASDPATSVEQQPATASDEPASDPATSGEQPATSGDEHASDPAATGGDEHASDPAATGGDEQAPDAPTPADPTAGDQDAPHDRQGNQGNGRPGEQPSPPWSPLVSRERS